MVVRMCIFRERNCGTGSEKTKEIIIKPNGRGLKKKAGTEKIKRRRGWDRKKTGQEIEKDRNRRKRRYGRGKKKTSTAPDYLIVFFPCSHFAMFSRHPPVFSCHPGVAPRHAPSRDTAHVMFLLQVELDKRRPAGQDPWSQRNVNVINKTPTPPCGATAIDSHCQARFFFIPPSSQVCRQPLWIGM